MASQTTAWTAHYFIRVQFPTHEYVYCSMADGERAWWIAREKAVQYHVPVVVTYGNDNSLQEVLYTVSAK